MRNLIVKAALLAGLIAMVGALVPQAAHAGYGHAGFSYFGFGNYGYSHLYRPYGYYGYGHGHGHGHGYGYGYGYGPPSLYSVHRATALAQASGRGGLDLDVKPKKAQVYVDGEYVGTTGDFDGYPSVLWLDDGEHEVAFYKDGHSTVVREYDVRPGVVNKIKFRLEPGEAIPPRQLSSEVPEGAAS